MPKIKTHKGTAKRVKLTSTGKLTRRRAFGSHILSKEKQKSKTSYKHYRRYHGFNGKKC